MRNNQAVKDFIKSKKFGDKLEKGDALTIIKRLHPNCTIHSPNDDGVFRENGLAIPDHIVKQNGKTVAMYDSKNKKSIYSYKGVPEKFWSADEKLLEYRKYSTKYKAPCYLIFYNKKSDKNNVYIVNVNVEPKFYKRINNKFGEHWYGYYLSQTTQYPVHG